MTLQTLIASLGQCKSGPYHLERDAKEWKALPGAPPEDLSEQIEELARDIKSSKAQAPLALQDLDALAAGIKNLTLQPRSSSSIITLFSRLVKKGETASLEHFLDAINSHYEQAHLADFESVKRSLVYLVKIDDINRFAALYRRLFYPENKEIKTDPERVLKDNATRAQFEEEMRAFIKSIKGCHPNLWLQRIEDDLQWPCSLVPIAYFANLPKHLDLQGCDHKAISDVLKAHLEQKYSQLAVSLSCHMQFFCRLVDAHLLDCVINLDLQHCQGWFWNGIEQSLAKLKSLQNVTLPTNLDMRNFQWNGVLQGHIGQMVKIQTQQLRARASQQPISWGRLDSESRMAVIHLFSSKQPPKDQPSICYFDASGILRTQLELLELVNFQPNGVMLELSYCPQITREGFSRLFAKVGIKCLNLRGCTQVDDSYFTDHRLLQEQNWFTGEIELSNTQVSSEMIGCLRRAQPRATFRYSPEFLSQLKVKNEAFKPDAQGLSDDALDAILHLKYTGSLPLISLAIAMELITSKNSILASTVIRKALIDYCKYILRINVDQENVLMFYEFAQMSDDSALMYACRIFIDYFYSPNALDVEKKRIFERITQVPMPKRPPKVFETEFTHHVGYFKWDPEQIHFSLEAVPLNLILQQDNAAELMARLKKMPDARRMQQLECLAVGYPAKHWLHRLPEWIRALEPASSNKVLDLSDCSPNVVMNVLGSLQNYANLEVIVNCSQDDFVSLCLRGGFDKVRILDLRKCPRLEWPVIEPHLVKLQQLHNVFLPLSLEGLRFDLQLSNLWRQELDPLIRQQLIQLFAKKNLKLFRWFLEPSQREPYFELLLHILLIGFPANKTIRYGLITKNFLFQAFKNTNINSVFHCRWNYTGLDIVTPDLVRSLTFHPGPLSLNFSYCSNITQAGLSKLLQEKEVNWLSFFGCEYVDDSFFEKAPLKAPFTLDLRGTNVSLTMRDKLQAANITVLYDTAYQASRSNWEKRCGSVGPSELSLPAFKAAMYFLYTGYLPILSIPVAMELFKWIKQPQLQKLKEHCLKYLACNVNQKLAFELYQFAKETNEPLLLFATRCFIEFFCNPHFPLTQHVDGRFEAILREPPPKPCDIINIRIDTEKQEPATAPSADERKTLSANFDDVSLEDLQEDDAPDL